MNKVVPSFAQAVADVPNGAGIMIGGFGGPGGMPQYLIVALRDHSFPLTGSRCVSLIVTDVAVIEVTPSGLLLLEVAPDWTPQWVQDITEPRLALAASLKEMEI